MKSPAALTVLSRRYRLEDELGRGAMGIVYRAWDLRHRREVAVKVLAPALSAKLSADRFLTEIEAAARLQHPNILPLHDSGDHEGTLFYVTPRIRGESLEERLWQQGPFGVGEAVRIAREVAGALAHAHTHGVVHRDIKPGNILLDREGHVYLADFGIARALWTETSSRLTDPGAAVGSPTYMSPEQCGAREEIDGRSDIYGLGCVLYEMLAGSPPFEAENAQKVLTLHLTQPPPPLRTRRADVPPELERVVLKALAKDPSDRFSSAESMEKALGEAVAEARGPPRTGSSARAGPGFLAAGVGRPLLAGAVVAMVAVIAFFATSRGGDPPTEGLDTTRIAIFPFRKAEGVPRDLYEDILLRDAFARWTGIDVVDPLQVSDALAQLDGRNPTVGEAPELAGALGAGRYVLGSIRPLGDVVRLEATLHDVGGGGTALRRASVRLGNAGPVPVGAFAALADSLLFGGDAARVPDSGDPGTRSVAAWRAFGGGQQALQTWDLPVADSLFLEAVRADPGFARANLWLAQVRHLGGEDALDWNTWAERASADASALPERERGLAAALTFLARKDHPRACEAYERLREVNPRDFAAHYGLGECRRLDRTVVRDRESPSGWAFRSSRHRAVESYRQAFDLIPSSHTGFRADRFARVRELFMVRSSLFLPGVGEEDPDLRFVAYPGWTADTLSLVPYPWTRSMEAVPPSRPRAQAHLRQLFRSTAETWLRAFPQSSYAREAWALALEMVGDPGALRELRRARDLSRDPGQALRLAAAEVFLLLKRHEGSVEHARSARLLADSLLRSPASSDPEETAILGQIAGVVGRPALAASLARLGRNEGASSDLPRSVTAPAAALLAFAALGGPVDSVAALEAVVEEAVQNAVSERARPYGRLVMEQPALLAFPRHVSIVLDSLPGLTNPVARAQAMLVDGDTAEARRTLLEARRLRESHSLPPADWSIDVILPEASLIATLEGPAAGAAWIDPVLGRLRWIQPGTLDRYFRGGVLVRAMAFRAEMAAAVGDEATARRWASVVVALWEDAEPALRPVVERMEELSR